MVIHGDSTWNMKLRYIIVDVSMNNSSSSSTFRLSLDPHSTQHQIRRDAESNDIMDENYIAITGPGIPLSIELQEEDFLYHVDHNMNRCPLYQKFSQLLHPSLEINPQQRNKMVNEMIVRVSRAFLNTIGNKCRCFMSIDLQIVTTYHSAVVFFDNIDGGFTTVDTTPSVAAALKQGILTSSHNNDYFQSCPICFNDFGSSVTLMPCSHVFHRQCIIHCLNNTNSCPLCDI
jgi:hypothetical protein|uniref:RING-type E3 ubiquitin transferase n=1 Tax=Fagus sylvatica TaxID=28930 RepID=A0A2N9J0Z5_FAGSY